MRVRWIEDKLDARSIGERFGVRVLDMRVGDIDMGKDENGQPIKRRGVELEVKSLSKKQLEALDAEFAEYKLHRLTAGELI